MKKISGAVCNPHHASPIPRAGHRDPRAPATTAIPRASITTAAYVATDRKSPFRRYRAALKDWEYCTQKLKTTEWLRKNTRMTEDAIKICCTGAKVWQNQETAVRILFSKRCLNNFEHGDISPRRRGTDKRTNSFGTEDVIAQLRQDIEQCTDDLAARDKTIQDLEAEKAAQGRWGRGPHSSGTG